MTIKRFLHLQVAGVDYIINSGEVNDVVCEDGVLQVHYRSDRILTLHDVPKTAMARVLQYFTSL